MLSREAVDLTAKSYEDNVIQTTSLNCYHTTCEVSTLAVTISGYNMFCFIFYRHLDLISVAICQTLERSRIWRAVNVFLNCVFKKLFCNSRGSVLTLWCHYDLIIKPRGKHIYIILSRLLKEDYVFYSFDDICKWYFYLIKKTWIDISTICRIQSNQLSNEFIHNISISKPIYKGIYSLCVSYG